MFRAAAVRNIVIHSRSLRTVNLSQRARPLLSSAVRFNSSSPDKYHVDWNAPKLTYEQVKERTLQPSPYKYLVDVREPDEVILGSIPSSVNLPLSTLGKDLHLNPVDFKAKHGFEKPKRDQEVVFYCRTGKRSASAADIAKKNGYTNVYNYEGSWVDWTTKEQGKED